MENSNSGLRDFLAALEKKLETRFPGTNAGFRISVCGYTLELDFETVQQAEKASRGLKGRMSEAVLPPDAVFVYREDRCADYVGETNTASRWCIRRGGDSLYHIPNIGFAAGDSAKRRYYFVHDTGSDSDPLTFAHVMMLSFHQWGSARDLMMLHSAVVGASGKGVMIGGRGGAGKSTLAASCLIAEMQFVGDDCVMITGSGPLEAMPVYTSLSLNPDMAEMLKVSWPQLFRRDCGKLDFDVSGHAFAEKLPVKGIIVPQLLYDEPEIRPFSSERAVARIASSSMEQIMPDREYMLKILSRLKDVPAFEFRQSADPRKNTDYLGEFISKEL